ncbi:translocase [Thetidibacter halocola]|uniref:Protein translocase subunit SecA n=1 Tax=Thetidibacter halocola TaxID=2827239 RepID=A0A8J7WC11_9RHOB|nr:translocase [Thetidibacter halocola]MBS0122651.1 translocase [Thetidibacter halocola]
MPEVQGLLGFGRPSRGIAPYAERSDPRGNAVDLWLERRLGWLEARAPLLRRRLLRRADQVMALEPEFRALSDDALRAAAQALRPRLLARRRGDVEALVRAFAAVREASDRVLGKRHYKVQVMGALGLYEGRMVEMATGEGKTLTATPAAVVAALAGDPVHVVTVNDYLAARDAEETRPLYGFFGLTVGVIDSDMDPEQRRDAYRCDITYVSNANLTFDYLRDRIALKARRGQARHRALALTRGGAGQPLMLRGLAFAIVDEADSVFVDEARTPLILSTTADDPEAAQLYADALALARSLTEPADFRIDRMNRQVELTEAGKRRLTERARAARLSGLWAIRLAREELARQALSALHLFESGREYVVREGKVQIVDEFTGRIMPDRSWQGGLHQMIEAREAVEVTGRKETLARITYQRFFRRYMRLSGMTGTGMELAAEFRDTFDLTTVRIPRHRPLKTRQLGATFVRDEPAKWQAVAERVAALHGAGRPVLIGTRSVEASQRCAAVLEARGLPHEVLNATQDRAEAEIVAEAGRRGAITVATNIAGRGTDIIPGADVLALGGLHVILTEFHESARIDRQLFGRTGRQGNPGSTEAIVALSDELFTRFTPWLRRLALRVPVRPVLWALRARAQGRAEAEHALTRREQTALDRQLERALAFSGPTE